MPEGYIRVGALHSSHGLIAVQPASAYPRIDPRIDPQQSQQKDQQGSRKERERPQAVKVARRFTAMRRLVEQLKKNGSLQRVDVHTADREMRMAGLTLAEAGLHELLAQHKAPLGGNELLFSKLTENPTLSELLAGKRLAADHPLLPASPAGLTEYNLVFQPLPLPSDRAEVLLKQRITTEGCYFSATERLQLKIQPSDDPHRDGLEMSISALVGAVEIDRAGRRAVVYLRPDRSFGLYADKQIDLAI